MSVQRLRSVTLRKTFAGATALTLLLAPTGLLAMSLPQAVRVATQQDATIRALQQDIARETTGIEVAKDGKRPQISIGGSTSSTTGDAGLTLTLSQVLFDWGAVKSRIEAATQERAKVVATLKMAVEELSYQISELYIGLEVADMKLAKTQEYSAFAQRIAAQSEARVAGGLSDSAEIARARLEIARANERLTQLTSDRTIQLTQLEFLVGEPVAAPQLAPNLSFAERFASSSAAIAAVVLAPDYIIARAEVDIAASGISAAKAASRPKIALQAEARQELTGGRGRSAAVGLTAGVDLTTSGMRGRGVTMANQALESAKSRLNAVERMLQNNIRTYAQELRLLRTNEQSQQEQLDRAQEVLTAYEEQFIGGKRELIDILTTGRDLYEAQIAAIETFNARKITEYEAARSVGMLGSVLIEAQK